MSSSIWLQRLTVVALLCTAIGSAPAEAATGPQLPDQPANPRGPCQECCDACAEIPCEFSEFWCHAECEFQIPDCECVGFRMGQLAPDPDLLREVRDTVLSQDPNGRRLVRQYYRLGRGLLSQLRREQPQVHQQLMALLKQLEPTARTRLTDGRAALPASAQAQALDLIERIRPRDGSEPDTALAGLASLLRSSELLGRLGLALERTASFAPFVSYIEVAPAEPGSVSALRVVGSMHPSDLEVGRVDMSWPAGFAFLGLPPGPTQVGRVVLEGVGQVGIFADANGRAVVDGNGNGFVDFFDTPISIGAGQIEVVFPEGPDSLAEVSSYPGFDRAKLILEFSAGLYRSPSSPAPLGTPVQYRLTAVSESTGLAADGTRSVEGAIPVTIASLEGRLIAEPPVGTMPALTARMSNSGPAQNADIYAAVLRPDGALWTLNPSLQWTTAIAPVVSGFAVPSGFAVANIPLPSGALFGSAGDYQLYLAVTRHGTFDFISLTTTMARVE